MIDFSSQLFVDGGHDVLALLVTAVGIALAVDAGKIFQVSLKFFFKFQTGIKDFLKSSGSLFQNVSGTGAQEIRWHWQGLGRGC